MEDASSSPVPPAARSASLDELERVMPPPAPPVAQPNHIRKERSSAYVHLCHKAKSIVRALIIPWNVLEL